MNNFVTKYQIKYKAAVVQGLQFKFCQAILYDKFWKPGRRFVKERWMLSMRLISPTLEEDQICGEHSTKGRT